MSETKTKIEKIKELLFATEEVVVEEVVVEDFTEAKTVDGVILNITAVEKDGVVEIVSEDGKEIAAAGGGILNSAKKLQETSEHDLYQQSAKRLEEVMQLGTGAVEIKSGYGLTLDADGNCVEKCGKGYSFGSLECDDGNTKNLDGCSDICEIE